MFFEFERSNIISTIKENENKISLMVDNFVWNTDTATRRETRETIHGAFSAKEGQKESKEETKGRDKDRIEINTAEKTDSLNVTGSLKSLNTVALLHFVDEQLKSYRWREENTIRISNLR